MIEKEAFKAYAEIKTTIKQLEAEADKLNEEILASMRADGIDKVESDFGQFIIAARKAWKYSPAVEKASDDLKVLKKKEEETGIATPTETPSLTFRAPAAAK